MPSNQSQCIFPRNSRAQMMLCAMLHAALHTVSFVHRKMHSDWFNGIEKLQGRWQHAEKVGYCYPSGLEKTLCKWDIYVPLVTKGLSSLSDCPFSLLPRHQSHYSHRDYLPQFRFSNMTGTSCSCLNACTSLH